MDDQQLQEIRRAYEDARPAYGQFADAVRALLRQLCDAEGLPVDTVTARAKETRSVIDKLRKRPHYTSLDDVTDKCGVRIVARYRSSVGEIIALLHEEFDVLEIEHHGDQDPEAFGYASDHVLLRLNARRAELREWRQFAGLVAEVQVRSILQHAWAAISHTLDYKEQSEVPRAARRRLHRVAALLEMGDEHFDTYREEVTRAREGYKEQVEREDWRHLDVDLDSLSAVWPLLPVRPLIDAAHQAGFIEWDGVQEGTPDADLRNFELPVMVRLASAVGVTRVGELADAIDQAARDREFLRDVAQRSQSEGFTPYAVAPDLAALYLLAQNNRNDAAIDVAREEFADALVSAAVSAGRERFGGG